MFSFLLLTVASLWIFLGVTEGYTCYYTSRYYDQFLKRTLYLNTFRYCEHGCCGTSCCKEGAATTTTTEATPSDFDILSVGAIVGVVISVLFFIGLVGVIIYVVHRMCFTPFSKLSQPSQNKPNLTGKGPKYIQHKQFNQKQERIDDKMKKYVTDDKFEFGYVESDNEYETIDDDTLPEPSPIVYNTLEERRSNVIRSKADVHISDSSSDEQKESRPPRCTTLHVQSPFDLEKPSLENRESDNNQEFTLNKTYLDTYLPFLNDIGLEFEEVSNNPKKENNDGYDNPGFIASLENLAQMPITSQMPEKTEAPEEQQEEQEDQMAEDGSEDAKNIVYVREKKTIGPSHKDINKSMVNLRSEIKPNHTPCPRSMSLSELPRERKATQPILTIEKIVDDHALTTPDVDGRKSPVLKKNDVKNRFDSITFNKNNKHLTKKLSTLKSTRISVTSLASIHSSEPSEYDSIDPFGELDNGPVFKLGPFDESDDEGVPQILSRDTGTVKVKSRSFVGKLQKHLSSATRMVKRTLSKESESSRKSSVGSNSSNESHGVPVESLSFEKHIHKNDLIFVTSDGNRIRNMSEGNLVDMHCLRRQHSSFINAHPIVEEEV